MGTALNQGPKPEAVGEQAMVSTQLPAVTDGALEVLRNGGNAADAFITAVFLQHVHDYHQVSHFGAISGLYYAAAAGRYHAFNGFSERPRADRCDHGGNPEKVAIGGTVRTLEALWKKFGTMEWAEYLEPAIRAAEEGVPVTSFMYTRNYERLRGEDRLIENREAAAFYMPEGFLVPVGERWKMPALAAHLRKVAAEGAGYMYTGAWGRKFVEAANEKGYCVTEEDMAEYRTRWLEPLRFTYRAHEIVVEPPPNSGGVIVGQNLQILENFDLAGLGHYSESPATLEIMARVFGRVEDETRWTVQDPASFLNPVHLWSSKEYAALSADFIRHTMRREGVSLAPPASESGESGTGAGGHATGGPEVRKSSSPAATVPDLGSNHNVIVDGEGNWISSLHTGHGGAPGVFIDGVRATGSGVRAETRGPGRRIIAAVTATMVARDGTPWLSLGTPGYPPQPVTEVLVNILDYDMPPRDAADAPRFWAFLDPETREIRIESRISDTVRDGMAASGIELRELGPYYWSTGSMQIVWRDAETGRLHGVTDPRRLGKAAGF